VKSQVSFTELSGLVCHHQYWPALSRRYSQLIYTVRPSLKDYQSYKVCKVVRIGVDNVDRKACIAFDRNGKVDVTFFA
jgi:hypothetical protein